MFPRPHRFISSFSSPIAFATVLAVFCFFVAANADSTDLSREQAGSRAARSSPLRWGKREPLRWGKRSVDNREALAAAEADMAVDNRQVAGKTRMLREAPLRWGKRSVSDEETAVVRNLRESPLRWGKRTMRSLDMAEMAAEMAASQKRAPLRWGKRAGSVRFGKRVLPMPALAPAPPAYYGGDADDEAALLEELLEEAGFD